LWLRPRGERNQNYDLPKHFHRVFVVEGNLLKE
jgi:hypothetical protein